jgi:acyl-CoA thioester hydrolase
VQSWEIDQMGHMNVQFYFEKALQGCMVIWKKLAINDQATELGNQNVLLKKVHIRFLKEQKSGAPFFIRAGIVDVGSEFVTIYLEMIETITNIPVATFTFEFLFSEEFEAFSIQQLKDSAKEYQAIIPEYGSAKGLSLKNEPRITLKEATKREMLDSFEAVVLLRQCDDMKLIKPSAYMGIVSDSTPHLLAYTGTIDENGMTDIGSAALEYRFDFQTFVQLGTHLKTKSAIEQISNKTFVWKHWIFDVETGEAAAIASAVAVTMDLKKRKSIPIPIEMSEALNKLIF